MSADVEEVRRPYRRVYSQVQMIMPDRTLAVATEANACFTNAFPARHRGGPGMQRA